MICSNCHTESPLPEAMRGWLIKWNKAYCPDCKYIVKENPKQTCTTSNKELMELLTEKLPVIETTKTTPIGHDPINHPKHYTSHPSGVECIQITRHMTFNIGNAIKYLWRAGMKDSEIQDLEKAVWYIKDEITRLKK